MSTAGIILISVLSVVICALVILIVKNFASPKKVEAIPRLLKQGKIQNATKIAKQIISKDSKNYLAHYYLGKTYVADNKPDFALIEYKLVNENMLFGSSLNEIQFRKEYCDLLLKQSQEEEALKNYYLLTKLEPHNAENFYMVGHIYSENNRLDQALVFLQKAANLDQKHSKAHSELGLLYYRSKSFNDAKREISLAIKCNPDDYSPYYYLGKIQKESKDIASAIKSFEKAQRSPDVKLKSIIEHGTCYMMANRFDNAALDFQRAIELDKTNTSNEILYARYFLAGCYEKSRKIDKAIEQWEILYKRNKNFRDVAQKLSEYKDLETNDSLKDYLTSSNEEFIIICRKVAEKVLKVQVTSCISKKWGVQIIGVDKKDDSWMNVRKQMTCYRFYRDPTPVEEKAAIEILDDLKNHGCQKATIYSSSGFAVNTKRFAEGRPLELLDKPALEKILSQAVKA